MLAIKENIGLSMQLGHSVSLPYIWKAPGPLSNTKKK